LKFQRNYQLDIITPDNKKITINPPFTMVFNLTRNVNASANRCQIKIYNLGKNTRNQIYKDRYELTTIWEISLKAGYGSSLREVFSGNIFEASSTKEKTDWITSIECYDGMNAIQNGYTAKTVAPKIDKKEMIKSLISDMPGAIAGFFGKETEGEAPRGQVFMGQTYSLLQEITDNKAFIDNQTINILTDDETIKGDVLVLDSDQLLATPKRQDTFLTVSILFLPELVVGMVVEIRSLEEIYNGQYKVMGFNHNATISQAIPGDARTEIQLYYGANGLTEVSNV